MITANTEAQAARLRDVIGRPDLANASAEEIASAMAERLATDTAAAWEERLEAASVPCGKVLTLAEALAHQQMQDSPAWPWLDVPETGERYRVPGLGFRADWAPEKLRPAPTLGRDTDEILAELGVAGKDGD